MTDRQEELRLAAFDEAMAMALAEDRGIGFAELAAAVVAAGGDPPSEAWLFAANEEGSVRRRAAAWLAEASTWLGDAIAQAEAWEAEEAGDRPDGQLRLFVFTTRAKNIRDGFAGPARGAHARSALPRQFDLMSGRRHHAEVRTMTISSSTQLVVPFVHSSYERKAEDDYQTIDTRCIEALLDTWTIFDPIVDCCAPHGSGIVDTLRAMGRDASGVPDAFGEFAAHYIVTNPPYGLRGRRHRGCDGCPRPLRTGAWRGHADARQLGPGTAASASVCAARVCRPDSHAVPPLVERGAQGAANPQLRLARLGRAQARRRAGGPLLAAAPAGIGRRP